MKFKIIGAILVVILIGGLSFMADVAGVGGAKQASSSPAPQQSKPRPSSVNLDSLK